MRTASHPLLLCLLLAAVLPLAAPGAPVLPAAPGKPATNPGTTAPGPEAQRVEALLGQARTHREQTRLKDAAAALTAAEALVPAGSPLETGLRLEQAEYEMALSRQEEALARVERALAVLQRYPDPALSPRATYLKARVLYTLGCRTRDAAKDVNDEVLTPRALRYQGQALQLLETLPLGWAPENRPMTLGEREQDDFTALWLSYSMPFAAFKWTQKFKTRRLRSELVLPGIPAPPKPRQTAPSARIGPALSLDLVGDFLPADTLLLEYAALEGATIQHKEGNLIDPVVCFRIESGTGEATLRWGGLRKLQCAELRQEVERFRRQCALEDVGYAETAQRLYRMLLGPIEGELRNKKRLVICADGPLRGLPFQALMKPGASGESPRFLIEDFEIVYADSATAASMALREPSEPLSRSRALVICDPTQGKGFPLLKHALAEETAIRDALPLVQSLHGAAATEAALRTALPGYGLVHFAGHTLFDDRSPWKSGLLLAPAAGSDGILTAAEILELRLPAGLVVLSSCRTAAGPEGERGGLAGLAGALFEAGTHSQVLTLWEVVDESAPAFMRPFYASLANQESRSHALQSAALKMLQNPRFRHPRHWAPFVLWGDWR